MTTTGTTRTKGELHKLFITAIKDGHQAGLEAVGATKIVPSLIGTPRNMMASLTGGDDGGFDLDKPVYLDTDTGYCGFVTVRVYGKKGEAKKFLNFITGRVKSRYKVVALLDSLGIRASYSDYFGGVGISLSGIGGQSLQKKEAYAGAFIRSIREMGIEGLDVYMDSRLD